MLRRAVLALAVLALATPLAFAADAQPKVKVDFVKPDAALAASAATGKPVVWYFLTGAAPADGKGSRPGC
jgi:hypothetical protein